MSRLECRTCGGSGKQRWCSLCKEPHRSVPPFIGCAVGDKPCPDCAFCVCGHARAAHDTLDSGAYVCRYAGCERCL